MINVGIVGFGNLGRAVSKEIEECDNVNLVAIFRRDIKSQKKCKMYNINDLLCFKNKIDLLILCVGSEKDLEPLALKTAKYFNSINTYDTHTNIFNLYNKLNKLSNKHNTLSILSAGWDPCLFSIIRTYFYSINNRMPECFWGKGVSLGHTNAVKNIEGVVDTVSYTIPNKKEIEKAKKSLSTTKNNKHIREVYVQINNDYEEYSIINKIKNIENYFKGQLTNVHIVSKEELEKLKTFMHKGEIISCNFDKNSKITLKFTAQMTSNPEFTAKIIMTYVKNFKNIKNKYKKGAYTPLHFSPLDALNKPLKMVLDNLC